MPLTREEIRRAVFRALGEPKEFRTEVLGRETTIRCCEKVCSEMLDDVVNAVEKFVAVAVLTLEKRFGEGVAYRLRDNHLALDSYREALTYIRFSLQCPYIRTLVAVDHMLNNEGGDDGQMNDEVVGGIIAVPVSAESISAIFSFRPAVVPTVAQAYEAGIGDLIGYQGFWGYIMHPVVAEIPIHCITGAERRALVTASACRHHGISIDVAIPPCIPIAIADKIYTPQDPEYNTIIQILTQKREEK